MSENKDNRSSRYDDPMWKVVGALRVGAIVGDIDRRLTALERINDERMMRDSEAYDRDSALEPIEHCKIVGCIVCGGPKDTVERFRVFEYRRDHWAGSYTRKPIGEIVATPLNVGGQGYYRITISGVSFDLIDHGYRALVDHNTKSGAWERRV